MNKCITLMLAISLLVLAGCCPDLVVKPKPEIDFSAKTVRIHISNVGLKEAGSQLTYIEINALDAPDSAKPQSQYSITVPPIGIWKTWSSEPITFSDFSMPRGLNLMTLTSANLVIRADAKNMVDECGKENNNVYDENR